MTSVLFFSKLELQTLLAKFIKFYFISKISSNDVLYFFWNRLLCFKISKFIILERLIIVIAIYRSFEKLREFMFQNIQRLIEKFQNTNNRIIFRDIVFGNL